MPEKKLSTLQNIKNRVLYLVESAPIKDKIPTTPLSVEKDMKYDRATMVHYIVKDTSLEILTRKFIRRIQISKYKTRGKTARQIPELRLKISKNVFLSSVQRFGMMS